MVTAKPRKIVMISSTSLDLPEHRAEVSTGCKKAGFDIRVMEELPALDADAIQVSMEMVDEADIYVGILAFRYGHVPQGHGISITEMEYDRAAERKIPRLIFIAGDDHPVKERDVDTDVNRAKLKALKARIGSERVRSLFISTKDLRSQVIEALANMTFREMARANTESEQEKVSLAKALKEANEALRGAEANPPSGETAHTIETAREHLAAGDTEDAKRIFAEIAEREERAGTEHNRKAAEAYRHQAALAYLDNTEEAARLYAKAAELDPEDGASVYRLALLQMRLGDLIAAKSAAERLLALRNRIDHSRIVYLAEWLLAEVARLMGDGASAEHRHQHALENAKLRVKSDPDDTIAQRDLSVSYDRVGDISAARGDRDGALKAYEDGLGIRNALAGRDPNNAESQRDLFVSYWRVGDAARIAGERETAETNFERCRELAERLATRDPGNTDWQRDRSMIYNKIGDLSAARGDHDGALKAYEDGLGIRKALAGRDPNNTEWQRDLSVSYSKIGDIRAARGDRDGALKAYEDGLGIRKALAEHDPKNAQWQTDLVVSAWKLAEVGAPDACAHLRKGLAILKRLDAENRLTANQKGWIPDLESAIASQCG